MILKVLMVSPFKASEGTSSGGIFAVRQIESLRKQGATCDVFPFVNRLNLVGFFRGVQKIRQEVRQGDYDVLHAQYGSLTALGAILAGKGLIPVVVSYCGSDINGSPDVSYTRSWMGVLTSQLSAFGANGIICKSEKLRQKLWFSQKRAVVIPNGVNLNVFRPRDMQECRNRLGLNPDTVYILFNNGNSDPVKREDLAREVVELVSKRLASSSEVELLLLRNVSPSEVVYYLNSANILIITSDSEGSPNILKEAVACQMKVASFDVGDTAFQLRDYLKGEIVERSVDSMAKVVVQLLNEDHGPTATPVSNISFSEDKIAIRILKYYMEVIPSD